MKKDKILAGILSWLIPGLGQVYCGQTGRGIAFFIAAVVGYFLLIIPGIVITIFAIIDAVNIADTINKEAKK